MEKTLDIIDFEPSLAKHFAQLNLAWIEKYFKVEPIDEEVLSNPQKHIISNGDLIFFAQLDEKIVGTFALIKVEKGVYELSKMAVAEAHHGKQIGNKMLDYCLKKARDLGADKVVLYSNTILEPAIHLYKKYGFNEVPLEHSEYIRSNINMEIDLNKQDDKD